MVWKDVNDIKVLESIVINSWTQILSFFMAAVVQATANTVTAGSDALTVVQELKKMLVDSHNMDSIYYYMNRAKEMLVALMKDHQQRIRQHVTKMQSRTHKEWVSSVGEIEAQVKILATRYVDESKKQAYIHSHSRSILSEEMRKKGSYILDLWEKGNQIEARILVDKEAECVVKIVEAPDIQEFPTLQNPLQDILNSLAKNKIKGIEVRGSVGCGKTTIMQNLNNHEKVNEMFDIVIWVKVSTEDEGKKNKNSSTEHLQKVIIQRLKLVMDGVHHVDDVANIIRKELESKKYLILLDDVKEDLYLDQVGIPLLNAKVGSKIVLATRKSNPLISPPSLVDKLIKVKKLSDKEAWKMFHTILDRPDLKMHIKQVKKNKVVKLGDGVPLMIKMVARCFRTCETKEDWSAEFSKLEYWPKHGDVAMPELDHLLNFCNGKLNDAQENCFLYSALYPEDSEIYVGGLLDSWWGENLLGGGDDAIDERDILRHLKKMLFLEEGRNMEYVRMQKWIRKVALYNMKTAEKHNHLVRTSEALKELPEEEHWRQKKWISLVDNHLHTLPDKPDCLVLSTLFLQENSNLIEIPDPFFERMKNLRVLGLYSTGIASLPSSLSHLINLKVLNLNNCTQLVELPSQIVKLQNLEVLDIRGSGLNNIPSQIQSLIRLRRLLATFISIEETNTQAEVISKISTLKELIFDVRFSKERWDEMLNDVLKNLIALKKLTNLRVCIEDEDFDVIMMDNDAFKISAPKADHLNSFVKSRDELESQTIFRLFVGCSITKESQPLFEYQRYVKYCRGESRNNSSILDLLQKADALEIVEHIDLKSLSDFGAPKLSIRGCLIQSCTKIRTILDGNILSNLECLYLNDLPELISIWDVTIQLKSLPELITLEVKNCPKLIEIFPHEVIQNVNQVYVNGVLTSRVRVFPKLKKFNLIDMPNLTRVYQNDRLEWPSLEKVSIINCPNLSSVPFNNENAIKLKTLKIEL